MCGIAAVLYLNGEGPAGHDLVEMVNAIRHRGADSCGLAYFQPNATGAEDTLVIQSEACPLTLEAILELLDKHGVKAVSTEVSGRDWIIQVESVEDARALSYLLTDAGVPLASYGSKLRVLKELGTAKDLDSHYHVNGVKASHGIGHARLATESSIGRYKTHPFWAHGFKNIASVHNGQLTNYYKLRRRFEHMGYRFCTDNDSELIAIYVAHYSEVEGCLSGALERCLKELDGTFTFCASTPTEMGFAKDSIGAKPLVLLEEENRVMLASEEVAIRAVCRDRNAHTTEPPPLTYRVWETSVKVN